MIAGRGGGGVARGGAAGDDRPMLRAVAILALVVACHRPPAAAPAAPAAPTAVEVEVDPPPATATPPGDRDGDGVADDVDRCPDQAMAMGPACPPAPSGCPDDCRAPSPLTP